MQQTTPDAAQAATQGECEQALTYAQFNVARALADHFGHAWGDRPCEGDFLWNATRGVPAKIAALVDAVEPDWPGITGPTVKDGFAVHTTGTGRYRWVVDTDGNALIAVVRVAGEVLRTLVPYGAMRDRITDGAWRRDDVITVDVLGTYHMRHVVALHHALGGLVDWEFALRVVAPLWADALPDPAPIPTCAGCGAQVLEDGSVLHFRSCRTQEAAQ